MNFRKFKKMMRDLGADIDAICSLAVEAFDNARDMKQAFDHIATIFRREVSREFLKQRMLAHAQVTGYDNSVELVRQL